MTLHIKHKPIGSSPSPLFQESRETTDLQNRWRWWRQWIRIPWASFLLTVSCLHDASSVHSCDLYILYGTKCRSKWLIIILFCNILLERFNVIFQYQVYIARNIPCPFPVLSHECNPDCLEGVRWWNFLEMFGDYIEPLTDYTRLLKWPTIQYKQVTCPVNIPFLSKICLNPINHKGKDDHLMSHAPSPRSCHTSWV